MSLAIGHFAFGAGVTMWILLFTNLHEETARDFAIAMVGGLVAMVPDVHQHISGLAFVHDTFVANFFFLHGLIDKIDVGDTVLFSSMVVAFMGLSGVVLFVEDHDS